MNGPAGSMQPSESAVILVDHGSRVAASNQMLHAAVAALSAQQWAAFVEPAHMELAEPSIATAFRRCVDRGAAQIIVFPWFLSPGRHWTEDIPRLVEQAAAEFPDIRWMISAPFGLHPGMLDVVRERVEHCLSENSLDPGSTRSGCDACLGRFPCRVHSPPPPHASDSH